MTGPRIFTATIAATAGNATATVTVPEGGMYKFVYGHVGLTTDATVANRRVLLEVRDSADATLIDIHAGAVVTASLTDYHHAFMQGVYRETAFAGTSIQVPVPTDLWLNGGEDVTISVDAGVAGDSFSGVLRFEFQEKLPY